MPDNHEPLPFHLLSDGMRPTLALAMETAFRCFLLDPHLGKRAALETLGMVLTDKIDLPTHPEWPKRVVRDLRTAFPNLQFIVTPHAPLAIGSFEDGKIFSVKDNQAYDFPPQTGKGGSLESGGAACRPGW